MTRRHAPAPESGRVLGTVADVAAAWGVDARLGAAASLGRAYAACLASTVEVTRRAKTLAGRAYPRQGRIVLNAALLRRGREADRDATFLHECAHVIADVRYRRSCGHDWRWRRVMDMLGLSADVCHDMTYLSPAAHAVVTWMCTNCGQPFHFVRAPRRRIEDCCCRRCGPRRGRLYRTRPGAEWRDERGLVAGHGPHGPARK